MTGRLKVLMVGPDRSVHGGISAVVNEFYFAGLDNKVELKYIGTMKEGCKLKKFLVAAFAFAHFLTILPRYDIVHVHFSSDTSFYRKAHFIKAAYRAGKKIVLHQHGGDFKTFYEKELSEKGRKKVQNILNMGNVMLVLTQSWKDYFENIIDSEKIEVFPNGIRTVSFQANKNEPSTITENEKDYNKILFLGRICKDKGIDELLSAMDDIHAEKPEAQLYIGGIYEDSVYRKKVEMRKEYVKYLGWVTGDKKDKYLDECGILTLPSYYEGFPVSIIEAMFRKNSVVASAVGGIPEIIDDYKDGILIEPRDPVKLKNAILEIMNNKKMAIKFGEVGQKKVIEKYSVEKNIENLINLYMQL